MKTAKCSKVELLFMEAFWPELSPHIPIRPVVKKSCVAFKSVLESLNTLRLQMLFDVEN